MNTPSTQTEPTLIERYQNYRTRRFLKHERTYANALPRWRTQRRRRILVLGLSFTFVSMFAVSLLCAFGIRWAPLLWLPVCVLYFPLWITLNLVSGRQGDAPAIAFSPRKPHLVLYLHAGEARDALLPRLGKHKTEGGCIYVKRLSDVDTDVLRELADVSFKAIKARYPD